MKLSDFDYELPGDLIAQHPLERRDASRLLLLDRAGQSWEDHLFAELPSLLRGGELIVVNNARVIAARLLGRRVGVRAERPGRHGCTTKEFLTSPIEVLLTRQISDDHWEALVRPGRKMGIGERVIFGGGELEAEVTGRGAFGLRQVRLSAQGDLSVTIERLGHVPLPPYIDRPDEPADRERYQTMFARRSGAVAAPTAGLHFTPEVVESLRAHGAELCEITLWVGLGTFQPIRTENIENHHMHAEAYEISPGAASQIARARLERRPILAVGTTVVRALEDAALRVPAECSTSPTHDEETSFIPAIRADAQLFIRPDHRFQVVNQLLTNFHLPKSSLLVLVSAFAGRELILRAYRHAIEQRYRFYSYGDCMLIR